VTRSPVTGPPDGPHGRPAAAGLPTQTVRGKCDPRLSLASATDNAPRSPAAPPAPPFPAPPSRRHPGSRPTPPAPDPRPARLPPNRTPAPATGAGRRPGPRPARLRAPAGPAGGTRRGGASAPEPPSWPVGRPPPSHRRSPPPLAEGAPPPPTGAASRIRPGPVPPGRIRRAAPCGTPRAGNPGRRPRRRRPRRCSSDGAHPAMERQNQLRPPVRMALMAILLAH
jgi:hypothetical protein